MDKEITMPAGKVGMDGTVTLKDGSKVMLRDGDVMSQKGELSVPKSDLVMDGLLKRDGKMMQLEKGKMKSLDRELTLTNGAKISPEGSLLMPDKNTVVLKEGDFVTMQGDVMMMKGSKLDSKGMESRISNDHLIFTGGRMLLVKDGEPQPMNADMTMPNGSKVTKAGQVVKKDATKYILREGEKVDMNGEVIIDKAKLEMDEKNYLAMKGGKMMEMKNGKEMPMLKEVLMPNWDKVMVDGTIEKSNGTKYVMKEGERVNMEGEMMSKINTGMAPAGNTAAAGTDCITMKNGKMCMIKAGKELPMAKEVLMPNGNKVMTNGAVIMKDGKTVVMKEGDKVDMTGNLALKK
jgi:archaellum component FlaG (FlaF/FlaG flagellin family)